MLELFILLQIPAKEVNTLIICVTLVFLLAPITLLTYVRHYNRRKKYHREEKELMQLTFESELSKTQMEVREQTMQTIGADLHDNIGQLLSLTSLTLKSVDLTDQVKAGQKITDAITITSRSIQEMRLLGKLLQGEQLIAMGLEKAIQQEVAWIAKAGQLKAEFRCEGKPPQTKNCDKELILFRILQEILSNCIKHANAKNVVIVLIYSADSWLLEINDDGIGFNDRPDTAELHGQGLYNIRKRAGIIGAKISINTAPGKGTQFSLYISYP